MMTMLTKQSLRLIYFGEEDKYILKQYAKTIRRGKKEAGWLSKAFTVFFACIIVILSIFTLTTQLAEKQTTKFPVYRVVYSDSMSDKFERNDYLFKNNLNDQFSRFDLIKTHPLPKEEDLKLYDIVVYEVDDVLLVHRIVGIEEPNDKHPNERHFLLQGDLVQYPDKFPVRYDQMKAIYRGEHIPNVGSFIMFLQSPAGWICIILIIVSLFAVPRMEKKVDEAMEERLAVLLKNQQNEKAAPKQPAKTTPVKKSVAPVKKNKPGAPILAIPLPMGMILLEADEEVKK